MEWIINNKEWLFSGIAIAVPITIISWFFTTKSNTLKQKSGSNSTNIQVGGNITINESGDKKNV